MSLHLIPQHSPAALANCLRVAGKHDALLLMGNGVYLILELNRSEDAPPVCALVEDVSARGLSGLCPDWVDQIDYAGFVELSEIHSPCVTWE